MNVLFDMPIEFRLAWFFCLGASIGSFLNVCILRLPADESIAGSGSHCRECGAKVRWYHNLPILGWLILRGRCASCGTRFSVRYLIIELATACAFTALYWWEAGKMGLYPPGTVLPPGWVGPTLIETVHLQFFAHLVLLSLVIVASFIDLDYQWIPDEITVPGTFAGMAFAAAAPWSLLPTWNVAPPPLPPVLRYDGFLPLTTRLDLWPEWLDGQTELGSLLIALGCYLFWCFALAWSWRPGRGMAIALRIALRRMVRFEWRWWLLAGLPLVIAAWLWLPRLHWCGLLSSLVGIAFGCGLVWIVRIFSGLAMGREALGFGDVVLVSMLGAFLGWQPIIFVFFLAPFFGLALTAYYYFVHREFAIPYGPSLCLGAATVIVLWYPTWNRMQGIFAVMGWLLPGMLFISTLMMLPLLWGIRLLKRLAGISEEDEPVEGESDTADPLPAAEGASANTPEPTPGDGGEEGPTAPAEEAPPSPAPETR